MQMEQVKTNPKKPCLPMNEKKYYFVDPRTIADSKNVVLKQGEVEKIVTEASWIDQYNWTPNCGIPDWEQRVSIMYPSAEYNAEKGKFILWYEGLSTDSPVDDYQWTRHLIDSKNSNHVNLGAYENKARGTIYAGKDILCRMESRDGIHWERPGCGEFYYETREGKIIDTNIVFVGMHGLAVRRNENPDPKEPAYLLAGRTWDTDSLDEKGDPIGPAISWSEDGIHWEAPITIKRAYECTGNIRVIRADTQNQLFWSPERGRYIVITRGYSNGTPSVRLVLYMEAAKNLHSIRDLQTIKNQTGNLYWAETSKYWSCPEIVLDDSVQRSAEPYSMPVSHVAEGFYIGIVSVANFDKLGTGIWNTVHAEAAWSPDAKNWSYIQKGVPFIQNAAKFQLEKGNDYGMIYCAAPVTQRDSTLIFYSATPELHYITYDDIPEKIRKIVDEKNPAAKKARAITRTSTLNIAKVQKDRFAGLCSEDGTIITKPFTLLGNVLRLTADIKEDGWLKLEILDEKKQVLKGYGFDDFDPIRENVTDLAVNWGGKDLSEVQGRTLRLRIRLVKAGIYTISGTIFMNKEE